MSTFSFSVYYLEHGPATFPLWDSQMRTDMQNISIRNEFLASNTNHFVSKFASCLEFFVLLAMLGIGGRNVPMPCAVPPASNICSAMYVRQWNKGAMRAPPTLCVQYTLLVLL